MTVFRVFFDDGTAMDVEAATPTAARAVAMRQAAGRLVTKIKRVKEPK